MATPSIGKLTPAQTQAMLQNREVMNRLGEGGAGRFVFFAAFDGTNNDRNNLKLSGSDHQTNVANLYDQAKANEGDTFKAGYYAGVGTGGDNGNLINAAFLPTDAVNHGAEQALFDFADQARQYLQANPDANRNDGTGETLAGDFMQHAMDAIAPAWAVQTTLAHWQAGNGLHLPLEKASLPRESADGMTQALQVLTLAVPGFEPVRESLIDIDGDGYLEATQWVGANQAMLAIDANGDGFIGAGELLHVQGESSASSFNSMQWLDANEQAYGYGAANDGLYLQAA